MKTDANILSEESRITEITVQPDGRIFVFGTSRGVLEVLAQFQPAEPRLLRLLDHLRKMDAESSASRDPVSGKPE